MYQKKEKRERKNQLQVLLSDKEAIILEAKFKESGLHSKSDFIRDLIRYGNVYYTDYSDLRDLQTELSRIGNNINQIAKKMNETGVAYSEDVKEVKEKQERIWQLLKSILSNSP